MTSSLTVAVFAIVAFAVVGDDGCSSTRSCINIAGLIPLTSHATGDRQGVHVDKPAQDVLCAVKMAIGDVNRNPDILPNYDLRLFYNDTKVCDSATLCRFYVNLAELFWSVHVMAIVSSATFAFLLSHFVLFTLLER